jgi:hypothetical protein
MLQFIAARHAGRDVPCRAKPPCRLALRTVTCRPFYLAHLIGAPWLAAFFMEFSFRTSSFARGQDARTAARMCACVRHGSLGRQRRPFRGIVRPRGGRAWVRRAHLRAHREPLNVAAQAARLAARVAHEAHVAIGWTEPYHKHSSVVRLRGHRQDTELSVFQDLHLCSPVHVGTP